MATSLLAVPPSGAAEPDFDRVWKPRTPLPNTASVPALTKGPHAKVKPPRPVPERAAKPRPVAPVTRLAGTARPVAKTAARAGGLPVWVAPAGGSSEAGPPAVTVVRNDTKTARAAGVDGLLFTLTADGAAGTAGARTPVTVGFDTAALQQATGGRFAAHGRLVRLPACAATTPHLAACQVRTPLATHYDKATGRLTADVTVSATTAPAAPSGARSTFSDAVGASAAPLLLAAETEAQGGGGDYTATALTPSSAWASGSASGALTYNYPLQVPPALGGAAPQLALNYDSSSVDGRTSATNAQASWIGDGWDLNPGFIERTYKMCDDAGIDGSGDLCWSGHNASLSLGPHSGPLVRVATSGAATDAATGVWRLKNDDGTRVEFGSGAGNSVRDGAYAKVTDPTGTVYYFGVNHLPGGDKTDPATNSVSSVPVYSPESGDPCYDSAKGNASWCQMWQRLSLDHVVDPHGNLTQYKWAPETNHYNRGGAQNNGTGTQTAYTRATTLASVAYGQRLDEQVAAKGTLQPAARVTFTTAERCVDTAACDPSQRIAANSTNWPDVPVDQECKSTGTCTEYAPTYFTTKRLASVLTEVRVGGAWKSVDSYTLGHSFPDPKDTTSQKALWLDSVQRTGLTETPNVPMSPVKFTPVMLPNRVDGTDLVPAPPIMNRPRIQQIANETGGVLNVDYNLPACSRVNNVMPAAEDDNTLACYPVRWSPPGSVHDADPVLDWFHHYTVRSLTENDTVTDAPQKITSYAYGPAGWHRDDNQFTEANARTWGEFRGFKTVTVTTGSGNDGPRAQVRTTYRQGMNGDVRKSGSARSVTLTDALGNAVTDHEWLSGQVLQTETFDQAGGSVTRHSVTGVSGEAETATQSRGTGLPALVARVPYTTRTETASAKKTDGTWSKTTKTTVTDAANGNRPVTELDHADGTEDVCTRSSYASGPDPQRTNLVSETLKVSGANACTAAATAANTVERKRVLFDGKPFGQTGATGNPTGTQVLDEYAADGTPQFTTTATTEFDAYGRTLTVTDPTRTDTQHPGGALTRTTYSPATGELPSKSTLSAPAPDQVSTVTWDTVTTLDPRRGLPLTEADPNGKTKTLRYDALGRMTAAWRPGRAPATEPNADMTFDYSLSQAAGVPSAVTTSVLKKDGTSPVYLRSINILDGFGRDRQIQASPANPAYTGRLISDKLYDSQGRVRVANASWYNNASGPVRTLAAAAESSIPSQNRTTYDGQGRTTVEATWSLGVEQSRTTTSYPGADRTDTVPPAGSWPSSVYLDARGRTTERRQYRTPTVTGIAADATVSTYTYTPDGKAATRKDAAGNTWSYGYDLRGRQTSATEPDTGTTTQGYDTASRLVSSKDGRGKVLLRTYDLMDRQLGLYDGAVSSAKQLTGWTYDTVTNGKGKPASSTRYVGGTGGQAYTNTVTGYDNGYRATGMRISIPGSEIGQTGTFTYTATSTFDKLTGERKTALLPAIGGLPLDDLLYSYNDHGQLYKYAGATTYDVQTEYDAFGRVVRSTVNPFTKQVVTTLGYDPGSGRLATQFLDKQTSVTGAVQQASYTYDKSGRITSITSTPDNNPVLRDRECFTLDHLGRMTAAWTDNGGLTAPGPGQTADQGACANTTPSAASVGGGNPYWHGFSYDVTGNRTAFVNRDRTGDTTKDVTTTQGYPAAGTVNNGAGSGGPHAVNSSTVKTGTTTTSSGSTRYDGSGNPVTQYTSKAGTTGMAWTPDNRMDTLTPAIAVTGIGGKCLDVQGGSSANGQPIQIYTCNNGGAQKFSVTGDVLKVFNKCVTAMGTTAGSVIQIQPCDGSAGQTWNRRADGTLYNPASTRCIGVPGDVSTNSVDVQLADCGTPVPAGQKWTATDRTTSYVYDANGAPIVRRSPGKTTVTLGEDELTYDTVAKTLTGTRYYPIPGGMTMVRVGAGTLTIQQADHHGSGVLTVDANTLTVSRRAMDPFGNPRGTQPAAGVWGGQKGFVGGTKDDTTGLTYLGARQYDPVAGRFLNADPVIDPNDPQQWNGYAYSGSNPVNATDKSGLFCDGCSANKDNSAWDPSHGPGCAGGTCYYPGTSQPWYSSLTRSDNGGNPSRNGNTTSWDSLTREDRDYLARAQLLAINWHVMPWLPNFSSLLHHYTHGWGEDYILAPDDVDDLVMDTTEGPLKDYLRAKAAAAEQNSKPGETVAFDSGWVGVTAGKDHPDWTLAFRSFQYRATGTVEDGQISYRLQIYKNWNFDHGESLFKNKYTTALGDDFGKYARLHEVGLAQEFDVWGTGRQQTISFRDPS
ncbi:ricin-type beta-trefoil lectin domain protein [Streptomyces sp. NPDC051211]|uniref:ricin-type beta-trefoil lectin domain protein n=1 Tax=Streptomyces sp. NPDC051211 TaxID=3154643 RepID=UPI00344D761D